MLSSPELCFHDQNHLALSCFAISSKKSRRRKKNVCINYCCIILFKKLFVYLAVPGLSCGMQV